MRALFLVCFTLAMLVHIPVDGYSSTREEISYPQKQPPSSEVDISVVDNRLKVNNAIVGNKIEIFSIVGVKVMEIEIKYPAGEYAINLAKGYYIVRLGETVRKIVIR